MALSSRQFRVSYSAHVNDRRCPARYSRDPMWFGTIHAACRRMSRRAQGCTALEWKEFSTTHER